MREDEVDEVPRLLVDPAALATLVVVNGGCLSTLPVCLGDTQVRSAAATQLVVGHCHDTAKEPTNTVSTALRKLG